MTGPTDTPQEMLDALLRRAAAADAEFEANVLRVARRRTNHDQAWRLARDMVGSKGEDGTLAASYLTLSDEVSALREALGLRRGESLCGYRNGEGEQCLLAASHVDKAGTGWHRGIGWTGSGRVATPDEEG